MGNLTTQEVYNTVQVKPKHAAYTDYVVENFPYKIPTWSHPQAVANRILNVIQHTKYYGVQIIAPPGQGKTTVAKVLAHHIHKKDERFNVIMERHTNGESNAFRKLDSWIKGIPKRPTIAIFDDLSGVFGEMSDDEIDRNFKTLTEVRWVLDPATGMIPFIPILTYHYSMVVEKKFRSQNGMSIFCDFGNEEKTNIDRIAPKKTLARKVIKGYENVINTMFPHHYFMLTAPNGEIIKYDTDKPFRAACMITGNVGTTMVYSHRDMCKKCDVNAKKKFLPAKPMYDQIVKSWGRYGRQQLRQALFDRGYERAIQPESAVSRRFIEKLFAKYDTNFEDLWKLIYTEIGKGLPKHTYRKRKKEQAIEDELDTIAVEPEADIPTTMNLMFDDSLK